MDDNCKCCQRRVLIGPRPNPYWSQWASYVQEHDYKTTVHSWCGLGMRDYDTNKPMHHHKHISSTRVLPPQVCQCGDPDSHARNLRFERNKGEVVRGESAPHQRALQAWPAEMIGPQSGKHICTDDDPRSTARGKKNPCCGHKL